ncbi:MAG TPA: peptidase [Erythrobacter sp.]|nr:peptidase [Erythrobacter sp.]
MHIEVTRDVVEAMHAAAYEEHPREACGMLLGNGGRITAFRRVRNVHPTPETHFEIDPQALIDAHRDARGGGLQLLGYFHSHPNSSANPSAKDREMASGDGRIWVIKGDDGITFSRDKAEGFQRLSYKIVDA